MKWSGSLESRLMAASLLPVSLLTLMVAMYMITQYREMLADNLQQRGQLLARQLAVAADYGVFSGNSATLLSLAQSVDQEKSVAGVVITNRDGTPLASSGSPSLDHGSLAILLAGRQPADLATGSWPFATPVRSPQIKIDDFEAAHNGPDIPKMRPAAGMAVVVMTTDEVAQGTLRFALAVGATALLILVGAWWLSRTISRRVSRPMRDIADAVKRIGRGAEGVRIPHYPLDALQTLGNGVNQMATRLELSRHEMEARIAEATRQLRARKEEAEQANRAKSRFLAAASHDLRQPMHALGMFIATLARQQHAPESRHLIGQIDHAVTAMGDLLDSLLDISRLDAGVIEANPTEFALQSVLDRLASNFLEPAEAKGLELVIRHSDLWVKSDRILMERILGNLISNAIRYTHQGRILVAARRRRDHVRIEVRDNGIGIPLDAQRSIFQEFVQLNNPERDRSKGLGLGLAIVKRLINLLGHQLILRSRPGRGSIFALQVPVAWPVRQPASIPTPLVDDTGFAGLRVLVIDDDALVRDSLVSLLASWGCLVTQDTGNEPPFALLDTPDTQPQVILCDLRLAGPLNGREMIGALRAYRGEDTPAAIITGDTDPETMHSAGATGLSVLMKPLRPAQLRALLKTLQRQRSQTSVK